MNIKSTLKASVAAAALVAVAAPVVSSPAEAGAIAAGGDNNSVVISGNLTRSIQVLDNGDSSEVNHVDGGNDTGSRMRILVNGQLTESIAVAGIWEADLPNSQDFAASTLASNTTSTTDNAFTFRRTDISFSHASYGKLSIGHNSTSSDNKPSLDSTGNNNAGMSNAGKMRASVSTTKANSVTVGDQFVSYFGGRDDRIRYDTPDIMGFKLSGSLIQGDAWDVGLTYGATYGDFQVAAAVQYKEVDSATSRSNYGAGLAVKHSSGISAGAHYGRESNRSQSTNINGLAWGAEVGYTTSSLSNLGASSISLIYARSDEALVDELEATTWGLHVKQGMPAGVEVFAAYEIGSFGGTGGTNIEDVSVALIGTQINF